MDNILQERKESYKAWVTDNLGEKTGIWYSPYLEQLGQLLKKFDLANGYKDNFFAYESFEDFKAIYQEMTEQSDEDIERLVTGKGTPRYPEKFGKTRVQFRKKYAEDEFNRGERSKPDNLGGIPDWGVLMRSYLIFLYYEDHPTLIYPKKEKKIANQEGEVDSSINYWVISAGENSRLWDEFQSKNMIAIGWDYLNDLQNYESKSDVERKIMNHRADGVRPVHDTNAVWAFYHEIKIGDVVYVKDGIQKVLARGIVSGDYYYDAEATEYKHRRKVEWIQTGHWDLHQKFAQKTLTYLNNYPDLIQAIDNIMDEEFIDPMSAKVNEFRSWLSQQVTPMGVSLNDHTITQNVNELRDLEQYYEMTIFGETDVEQLVQLKYFALADESYKKYRGVVDSSLDYYIRFIETKPIIQENEPFSMEEFLAEVFIKQDELERLISLLENKKNLILKGAPGVGKTFIAKRLANVMMEEKDDTRIHMVQFHQSYSYEDFIEGFRPKSEGDGFELKTGPFVTFARKAARDPERDYFFIIDEINRGNMSKIFGELMMLIEDDKRGIDVNLLYSNELFSVPPNLFIIGMMNTADRSLALLDYALRRRFAFFEVSPVFQNEPFQSYVDGVNNPVILRRVINEIEQLNKQIITELGTGFQIGHSYFMDKAYQVDTANRVEEIIEFEIIPQLYEYWFDDEAKANDWAERLRGSYHGED